MVENKQSSAARRELDTLRELGMDSPAARGEASELTLRLPSVATEPLASPELIREDITVARTPSLKTWQVPVLSLEAGAALDLLLALPGEWPMGYVAGSSLRFWITAARLAFELLSRQAYMPALHEMRAQGKQVWQAAKARL